MFVAFSAAAMVYMASNIVSLEKHKHQVEHYHQHSRSFNPGSTVPDSANVADSIAAQGFVSNNDSTLVINQTAHNRDHDPLNPNPGKIIVNKIASANNAKTGIPRVSGNHIAGTLNDQNQKASAGTTIGQHAGLANTSSVSNRYPGGNGHTAARNINGHLVKPGHSYSFHPNTSKPNINGAANNGIAHNSITGTNNTPGRRDNLLIIAVKPQLNLSPVSTIQPLTLPVLGNSLNRKASIQAQTGKNKKDKAAKVKNNKPSNIDWGILTGVNSTGSFTSKSQNANFYGSAPVDLYFGLFASYKLNDSWAINPQVKLFSPQSITTVYSHANQSRVDSGQNLTITASRKVYSVSIPIYAVYNATSNISFKAGPVINFPIKQINTNSLLQPAAIKTDTTYYPNIIGILNKTQYDQKLNFGISGGASVKYKRFIFEATYLKSLSGYGITSGLGSYKSYNSTFQFTIGFQLDKVKP